MDRLDLDPRRAAPARLVGRVQRLDHDALVAHRQRLLEQLRPAARHPPLRRHQRRQRRGALGARPVEQILAVEVQQVEEHRRQQHRVRRTRDANRDPVTWNGCGRPSSRSAIASPSSTNDAAGSASAASTTSGSRAVTSSSVRVKIRTSSPERWTWIRAPSSFHSTAAGPGLLQRGLDVGRGRGQHRRDRAPDLEPERRQRLRAVLAQRRRGHRAEIAAQHQRPPHRGDRHVRGLGHRVADDRRQRALAQVAEDQRAQERLLGRRRPRQQRGQRRPPRGQPSPRRSAPTAPRTPRRPPPPTATAPRRRGGSSFSDAQPDPEHPLARRAREVAGARRALARSRARAAPPPAARPWPCARTAHGRPRWRRRARRTARRTFNRLATVLDGRTVLVTGASTGIGRTTALLLAALGATVLAGVRDTTRRRSARRVTPVQLDITERRRRRRLAAHDLDGLVNNAGIAITGPLEFLPLDELRHQLEVNVIAQLAVTQACLPALRAQHGPDRQRLLDLRPRRAAALRPVRGVEVRARGAQRLAAARAAATSRSSLVEPGAIATPIWDARARRRRRALARDAAASPTSATARSSPRSAAGREAGRRRASRPRPSRGSIATALTADTPAHPLRGRPRRPHPGRCSPACCPGRAMDKLLAKHCETRLLNNREDCGTIVRMSAPPASRSCSPRSASAPPAPPRRSARTGSRRPGVGAGRILVGGALLVARRAARQRSAGARAAPAPAAADRRRRGRDLPAVVLRRRRRHRRRRRDDRRARLRARAGRRDRVGGRAPRARPRLGDGDRAGLRRRRDARPGRARTRTSRSPASASRSCAGASYAGYTLAAKRMLSTRPLARDRDGGRVRARRGPAAARARGRPGGWLATPGGAALIVFLGIVPTARRLPAVRARPKRLLSAAETATLTLAEPLTATLLGVIVLSERMSRARGARRRADPRRACWCWRRPTSAAAPLRSRRDHRRDRHRRAAPGDPRGRAARRAAAGRAGADRALRRRPPHAARGAARARRRRARADRAQPRRARGAPATPKRSSQLYELRTALEVEAARLALERHRGRLPAPVHDALATLEDACEQRRVGPDQRGARGLARRDRRAPPRARASRPRTPR